MAVPHDIDSKHISEKIATQVGCAAMLTSSARDLQEVYDAYLAEKERAEKAEKELLESRKEIADLRATIALMKSVQPINNTFNIERDYVAHQNVN
jgi:hypothetical protein